VYLVTTDNSSQNPWSTIPLFHSDEKGVPHGIP
jgi:hypothetical protein